jgi:hypothetical protein
METKTVKGYPNYTVREDGLVTGARGKCLKYDYNRTGYPRISLCKNGKVRRRFVHRIVAEHFLPEPDTPNAIINHIDGDKLNNHYSNLEWTTHRENLQHALDTGLRDMKNKVEMDSATRDEVIWMLESGLYSYQTIANTCHVTYNAVALLNSRLRERATTIREEYSQAAGSAQPS